MAAVLARRPGVVIRRVTGGNVRCPGPRWGRRRGEPDAGARPALSVTLCDGDEAANWLSDASHAGPGQIPLGKPPVAISLTDMPYQPILLAEKPFVRPQSDRGLRFGRWRGLRHQAQVGLSPTAVPSDRNCQWRGCACQG